MKKFNISVFCLVSIISAAGFSKTTSHSPYNQDMNSSPLSEENLVEELTGKKASVKIAPVDLRKAPLSVQHYFAGQRAAAQKNYILAIKHYNTVIQNYAKTPQAARALVAKAQVYKEMGLQPQAARNLKLAQLKKNSTLKPLARIQEKNKTVK